MKGSVVQKNKGSKHWYAIIERRDEATGKRVRKWITLKASGKRQAQIECAKIIAELENGMFVDPSKVTLAKFFEQWLDDIKSQVSQKTYERYAEIARKNIVPLLGQVRVSKLRGFKSPRRMPRRCNPVAVTAKADYRVEPSTICTEFCVRRSIPR